MNKKLLLVSFIFSIVIILILIKFLLKKEHYQDDSLTSSGDYYLINNSQCPTYLSINCDRIGYKNGFNTCNKILTSTPTPIYYDIYDKTLSISSKGNGKFYLDKYGKWIHLTDDRVISDITGMILKNNQVLYNNNVVMEFDKISPVPYYQYFNKDQMLT
jgi:hypothetical protein